MDLSSLDAKMQEIEDSIHEMDQTESITASTAIPVLSPAEDEGKEEEEEEEDSDSEDEDEGGKCYGNLIRSHSFKSP